MRVGIKSAWIQVIGGGLFLILVTIITWWLSKPKKDKSSTQTVKEQKLDTGSISNYNSGRDLKIENNTYITKDT